MKIKHKSNSVLFFINSILTCIYLYWRIRYTIPLEYGLVSQIAGVILLVIELLGAIEAFIHYCNMHEVESYTVPEVPREEFPHVDVFIATYNESLDILYKTVNGCLYMEYPDKEKVHIYLCDDQRREKVKELAEKMGINYITRPTNEHAKAGNLNNAMKSTDSPLIVTLDADMIPKHNFLMKTVPYFVEAELKNRSLAEKDKVKLGFVQSPQSFHNPDLFQFYLFSENRIPNEQDYFYKDVQVARNKSNSVIYGGSNTVISRAALEEIGGFYTESITEDFATGILLQKAKYKCIAINDVIASGLSPTTLKDLIQQRVRWARGVIDTSRKMHLICTRRLTITQKINYLASMWYWYSPIKIFVYIMSPILFAAFGYVVIDCTLPEILIFWLPMYLCSNYTLKRLSGNIRTTKWSRIYETVLFPFMFFPVLLETFGISMKTFKVTQKDSQEAEGQNLIYTLPFWIFVVLSLIGIYNSIVYIFTTASMSPVVILFWLIANLFNLIIAIFFLKGRNLLRKSERVEAEVDCEITAYGQTVKCKTKDMSETGLSVILKFPKYFKEEQNVSVQLKCGIYRVQLKAKLVHVGPYGDSWKYAFYITELPEEYKSHYMQILYDRIPTLPLDLDEALSSFDDLKINITKRTENVVYANRKLPRISIMKPIKTTDGKVVHVIDFNYKFITIKNNGEDSGDINIADKNKGYEITEEMQLVLYKNLILNCKRDSSIRGGIQLYEVANCDEIVTDSVKRNLLEQWITSVGGTCEEQEDPANPKLEENFNDKENYVFNEMDYI